MKTLDAILIGAAILIVIQMLVFAVIMATPMKLSRVRNPFQKRRKAIWDFNLAGMLFPRPRQVPTMANGGTP